MSGRYVDIVVSRRKYQRRAVHDEHKYE